MKILFAKHLQFLYVLDACLTIGLQAVADTLGLEPPLTQESLEFTSSTFRVREDSGKAVVTVVRNAPSGGSVTVDYAATAGTNAWNSATAGADFVATSGTLVFGPGETNKIFVVQILEDGLVEGDENVLLTLSHPSDGTVLGGQSQSILTIEDNEIPTFLDESYHPSWPPAGDAVGTVLAQPDGKFILGGQFQSLTPGSGPTLVGRLNADGTRDTTFRLVESAYKDSGFVRTMALQPNGKIVITGLFSTAVDGVRRHNVARLNSDGSLDTNFTASLSVVISDALVTGILIEPDGKIILGRSLTHSGLVRLNADGSLDPTFDGSRAGGRLIPDLDSILQPDGKLIVGRGCLTRLNADGSRDASFLPCDGFLSTVDARPLAVRSDGRILAQIWQPPLTEFGGSSLSGLVLLNPDGSLNQRYPFPGVRFGHDSYVISAAYSQDGSALIAGNLRSIDGSARVGLARLFSNSGTQAFEFPSLAIKAAEEAGFADILVQRTGDSSTAADVAIETVNGSARAGQDFQAQSGTLHFAPLETTKAFTVPIIDNVLVNSNTDFQVGLSSPSNGVLLGVGSRTEKITIIDNERPGSVDREFNPPSPLIDQWLAQPDGRVLVSLQSKGPDTRAELRTNVFRLNVDGSIDTTFKLDIPLVPSGWGFLVQQRISALSLQPDGKILIGGFGGLIVNGTAQDGVARINSDGTLDTLFHSALGASNSVVNIIVVQSDGRLLIGENDLSDSIPRPTVARLRANGELDQSFDLGVGIVGAVWTTKLNSIIAQPDGKVLIAGDFTSVGGKTRRGVARLNPDGSLDTTFDPGSGVTGSVTGMALQPDGKIIIVGWFDTFNGVVLGGMARLNSNGSLDKNLKSFESGGVSVNDQTVPITIALQSDGRILLAGGSFVSANTEGFQQRQGVARVNADGTLDTSFEADAGIYIGDVCCDLAQLPVSSISVLPDGSILAGGGFKTFGGVPRPGLVRLHGDPPLRFAGISTISQMNLNSLPGRTYLLERSADLQSWFPVRTNKAASYLLNLADPDAANFPRRFYRARLTIP
jgi:uncharacterized delta-60 repeat protein